MTWWGWAGVALAWIAVGIMLYSNRAFKQTARLWEESSKIAHKRADLALQRARIAEELATALAGKLDEALAETKPRPTARPGSHREQTPP